MVWTSGIRKFICRRAECRPFFSSPLLLSLRTESRLCSIGQPVTAYFKAPEPAASHRTISKYRNTYSGQTKEPGDAGLKPANQVADVLGHPRSGWPA